MRDVSKRSVAFHFFFTAVKYKYISLWVKHLSKVAFDFMWNEIIYYCPMKSRHYHLDNLKMRFREKNEVHWCLPSTLVLPHCIIGHPDIVAVLVACSLANEIGGTGGLMNKRGLKEREGGVVSRLIYHGVICVVLSSSLASLWLAITAVPALLFFLASLFPFVFSCLMHISWVHVSWIHSTKISGHVFLLRKLFVPFLALFCHWWLSFLAAKVAFYQFFICIVCGWFKINFYTKISLMNHFCSTFHTNFWSELHSTRC